MRRWEKKKRWKKDDEKIKKKKEKIRDEQKMKRRLRGMMWHVVPMVQSWCIWT